MASFGARSALRIFLLGALFAGIGIALWAVRRGGMGERSSSARPIPGFVFYVAWVLVYMGLAAAVLAGASAAQPLRGPLAPRRLPLPSAATAAIFLFLALGYVWILLGPSAGSASPLLIAAMLVAAIVAFTASPPHVAGFVFPAVAWTAFALGLETGKG